MKPYRTVFAARRTAAATALLLTSTAAAAAAQAPADTFRIRQLVVTATKVPAPLAAVPAHVTVLTGEAMRAAGYTRVVDALRDQAGIAVTQLGAPGAVASLFLRGGESDYVQVLVDGVQVNDPGGAYDWAHLTTADVERIEIVRGPASVLYGSDAASGVVQVFTRRGAGPMRVEAAASAGRGGRVGAGAEGSFGSWSGSATVSGGGDVARQLTGDYSVTAAGQESDGAYAFNNGYRNRTAAGRFALARAGGPELSASARYTDQRFHYPTDGAGNVVDHNRYTYGDALSAGLTVRQPFGSGRYALQLALGAYRGDTGAEDPEDEPGVGWSRSTGRVERDQLELRLDGEPASGLTLSAGAALARQHGVSTYLSDGPFGPYDSRTADRRGNRAAFAQLVRTGRHVSLTAGARIDRSDQFGSFTTGRAGVAWQLAPGLRVHGALGTGFKEPTFLETYATGFARGNPDLQPEQSRSAELGVSAARGNLHAAVTAFRQSFRNLIQYTFTPPATDAPNYFNMGGARAAGIEVELGAALAPGLSARAGYTGLRTVVTDAGFGEDRQFVAGEPLLRRPGLALGAALEWRHGPSRAELRGSHTGARSDLDFTDPAEWQGRRVELPAYTTAAASFSYRIRVGGGEAETTVRLDNLLDADYQEVYNFPAPGRMLGVAVRVTR